MGEPQEISWKDDIATIVFFIMMGLTLMVIAVCTTYYNRTKPCTGSMREMSSETYSCNDGASPQIRNENGKSYVLCTCGDIRQ